MGCRQGLAPCSPDSQPGRSLSSVTTQLEPTHRVERWHRPYQGRCGNPRRRLDVDGSAGVEPAASAFAGLRSCPLSYDPILVLRAGVAPARPGFQAGALLLSYRSRGWSRRKESNLTSQRRAVYSRQAVPAASPGRWWTCRELNSHRAGASRASLPRDKPKMVLTGGVEPPRPRGHRLLKTACLPVPSGEQAGSSRNLTTPQVGVEACPLSAQSCLWSTLGGTIPVLRVGSASCCRVHLGCKMERRAGDDPAASSLATRCSTSVS